MRKEKKKDFPFYDFRNLEMESKEIEMKIQGELRGIQKRLKGTLLQICALQTPNMKNHSRAWHTSTINLNGCNDLLVG